MRGIVMNEKLQIAFGLLGGLAIFIYGMNMMSECLQKAAGEKMKSILALLTKNPLLGVLAGAVTTAVLQSSSATTVMAIGFVSAGLMSLPQAISIIFGANIGTTMTAQIIAFKISDYIYIIIFIGFIIAFVTKSEKIKSIGQSKDAKRTAVAHCIFNISGCFLFIWFVKPFAALIQYISPKGPEIEVISRQIANAHTVFNITMTLIWVCLINVMVKIVMTLIPDGKSKEIDPARPLYLDEKIINQPTAALQLVAKEILHLSDMVKEAVKDTISIVKTEETSRMNALTEKGHQIKTLADRITEYLALLFSSGTMTEQQASQTASLMYVLSDVERIGTLSVEIAGCIQEKADHQYKYTEEAMDELQKSLKTLEKMFDDSIKALQNRDSVQVEKLIKRKDKIIDLDIKMRKAHIQRVNKGKCKSSMTAPFTNILHLIDRMGNSCVNLADVATNEISLEYFMVQH